MPSRGGAGSLGRHFARAKTPEAVAIGWIPFFPEVLQLRLEAGACSAG